MLEVNNLFAGTGQKQRGERMIAVKQVVIRGCGTKDDKDITELVSRQTVTVVLSNGKEIDIEMFERKETATIQIIADDLFVQPLASNVIRVGNKNMRENEK